MFLKELVRFMPALRQVILLHISRMTPFSDKPALVPQAKRASFGPTAHLSIGLRPFRSCALSGRRLRSMDVFEIADPGSFVWPLTLIDVMTQRTRNRAIGTKDSRKSPSAYPGRDRRSVTDGSGMQYIFRRVSSWSRTRHSRGVSCRLHVLLAIAIKTTIMNMYGSDFCHSPRWNDNRL